MGDGPETVVTVVLKRRQVLLLVSDGLEEETVQVACGEQTSPAALAQKILRDSSGRDDATVVTVQLLPTNK